MLFSSVTFLFFFLPLVLAGYFAYRGTRWRNSLLLAASLLFYAWGEPRYLWLLLLSVVVSHQVGLRIAGAEGRARRVWLGLGVGINLGLLATFKYAGFVVENVDAALAGLGFAGVSLPEIPLPLGISFFVFQAISFLVDVYRREAGAARSVFDVALYIAMFPQLVAGPIVRYRTVAHHLQSRRSTWARSHFGLRLFIIGLAQKVLIADQVAPIADAVFGLAAQPTNLSAAAAWVGAVAYAVQIFFDFGGYSNMAIGLGLVFGFSFPRNFRFPYGARSVSEFWRRWHISLSSWFRDYLYIPLGGNRHGSVRTGRNLMLVFILCGVWHGASWNFVVWGLHHGAFLIAERTRFGKWMARRPALARHAYTLFVVLAGWVWFRSNSLAEAVSVFAALAGLSGTAVLDPRVLHAASPLALAALAGGIVLSFRSLAPRSRGSGPVVAGTGGSAVAVVSTLGDLWLVFLMLLSCTFIASGSFSPFLYFRF